MAAKSNTTVRDMTRQELNAWLLEKGIDKEYCVLLTEGRKHCRLLHHFHITSFPEHFCAHLYFLATILEDIGSLSYALFLPSYIYQSYIASISLKHVPFSILRCIKAWFHSVVVHGISCHRNDVKCGFMVFISWLYHMTGHAVLITTVLSTMFYMFYMYRANTYLRRFELIRSASDIADSSWKKSGTAICSGSDRQFDSN